MSERTERPSRASSLTIETMGDDWRITLLPVGVWRCGHGVFWVGVCFCAGIGVITAAFAVLPHVGSTHGGVYTPPSHQPISAPGIAVLSFFWIVSIGIVLYSINMGLRRGSVEVTSDVLHIRQTSPFSDRLVELPRIRIVAVESGPCGLSIGAGENGTRSRATGKSVDELHIYMADGVRLRFFTGRTTSELDALAEHLRDTLGVRARPYDGS